jgi:hypothetical protein
MDATEYIKELEYNYRSELFDDIGKSEEFVEACKARDRVLGVNRANHPDGPGPGSPGYSLLGTMRQQMEEYRDDLFNVMVHFNTCLPTPPFIAFIPICEFNAFATKAPNGEEICILDTQLFQYLYYISTALSSCSIQSEDGSPPNSLEDALLFSMAATFWFLEIDTLESMSYLRDIRKTRFSNDAARLSFSGDLAEGMMLFVLAHELAHHSLGHLDFLNEIKIQNRKGIQGNLAVYSRSQEQEFEADAEGARIFLGYMNGEVPLLRQEKGLSLPHPATQCAPLIFFDYLSIIEEVVFPNLIGRNGESNTHPPAQERAKAVGLLLEEGWDDQASRYYKASCTEYRDTFREFISDVIFSMSETT